MKRALVLEDSATARAVASTVLRAAGYAVVIVGSVSAARAAAQGPRYDLYLVDCGVPATLDGDDGDGLAFARAVLKRYPDARVVVWSAGERRTEADELGLPFVAKGGGVAALAAAIRACTGDGT